MITLEKLQRIFNHTPQATLDLYVDPINNVFEKYDLSTKVRQAMFLAQIGHESMGLQVTHENLNYSAKALLSVFHKYFTPDLASSYARNPEKIANRVYANRMGNRDESSGDGWKFRGRGAIQITGHNNYVSFANDYKFDSIDEAISYLETPEGIIMSAGWFWNKNHLNNYADKGDIVGATRVINGGTNGLDDRKILYVKALAVL